MQEQIDGVPVFNLDPFDVLSQLQQGGGRQLGEDEVEKIFISHGAYQISVKWMSPVWVFYY